MGQMKIMDRSGDTTLTWDPAVKESTDVVRAKFDAMIRSGFMAYQTDTAVAGTQRQAGTVTRKFDPLAEEIVIAAPLMGG